MNDSHPVAGHASPTRRTVLAAILATPVVGVLARAAAARRGAIAAVRPGADGRSTQRCASCGARDHSMLACPDAPEVV